MNRCEKILEKESVMSFLGLLRLGDEEAYLHSLEVAQITENCINILTEMKENPWSEEEVCEIITGALLHDIGKAFLPFGLQFASGKLDIYDKAIMQMHPVLGYEAVKHCISNKIVKDIILMHHANADGTGYPFLEGEVFDADNVPDYVWLVIYADRFEAMTNKRAYKKALSFPDAWQEILNMSRNRKIPYKFTRMFGKMVKEKSLLPIKEIDP